VLLIWVASDLVLLCSVADGGAVAGFRLSRRAVDLDQLREVDVCPECVSDRFHIRAMAVRRELYAVRQTALEILHELIGGVRIAVADHPAANELRIGVKRDPRPDASDTELAPLLD